MTTRLQPMRVLLYHGSAYPIANLEPSDIGLLEQAPPAACLTPDPDTAAAYARRTADRLDREQPQHAPHPPLVYRVLLDEPRAADLKELLPFGLVMAPAYRRSTSQGDHGPWTHCLDVIARALSQARRDGAGAAVILTPAGPDGELSRVPEYLSFDPGRNTVITGLIRPKPPGPARQPRH